LLPELKASYPNTAVIMATAVAEANLAIQCMRLGADDYITKPFNLDEVALNVEKTLEKRMLEQQIKGLSATTAAKGGPTDREIRNAISVLSKRWSLPGSQGQVYRGDIRVG